jgi:uncharacterized membrane protein
MTNQNRGSDRLAYIDWMRGLACVLMFQTHCYDAWLSLEARNSSFFGWSRLGGTLPAPLFIFLAGISVALVTDRSRSKGLRRGAIARQTILRGAEIFGLGLVFRLQEFALGWGHAPWTDLLRVDVLNILGLSIACLGVLCWLSATLSGGETVPSGERLLKRVRLWSVAAAMVMATAVAMLTPPLWTTYRLRLLPWPFESYINGVHIFGEPQAWLFPLFPWSAFAFAGLAAGLVLFAPVAARREVLKLLGFLAAGIAACALSIVFDSSPIRLYAVYDYWHSGPNFLLMRCGILLGIASMAYFWCRWGLPRYVFSPLVQLGKTSLLVYWVHIELVYGSFSILPKRQCSVAQATLGLVIIFVAMLVLSLLRTSWKQQKPLATVPLAAPSAN